MLHHLLPFALLAFTLVPLPEDAIQSLKDQMRAHEPATDEITLDRLATTAVLGENQYIERQAPSGVPKEISVPDGSATHSFIFIHEIADGKSRVSLEAI